MKKQQITDEAIKYCSHIDFSNDKNLSEKGRIRVREWAKQDFVAGANYVLRQLRLSGVIKSACLEGYEPIDCNQFTALGSCDKCKHKQAVL